MKDKLKHMMEKASFAAYRLTENGCLEIKGRDHKVVENYFLFDGKDYYFNNQLVQASSNEGEHNGLLLAMTATKLLVPQANGDYLYVARNFPAPKDLLIIVLYYYDNHIYYSIVSGNGSGRVHPVYMPLTKEGFNFCFLLALEAIATVNPEMAETLYTDLKQKCQEAKAEVAEQE